ncbi:MAG: RNA polymerase sigma factor [Terriglobales bacterium]
MPAPVAPAAPRGVDLTPETAAQFALMRRCQADEPGAFEELVRRFAPRVQSAIRGILRNSNDAEDIAQQVFTKVYFSRARFDFRSAVATWIYKIAVNECYDHLRKMRVRRAVLLADLSEEEAARVANLDPAALPTMPFGACAPVGVARQVETREIAAKLLAALPPEDRILLVMKEIEGHSIQELAKVLGLNENTVKVKLFRARQKLLAIVKRKRL